MSIMLANIVVEVLQAGTVELSYLFEALLELEQLELRQVLVQVFGDGTTSRLEDRVPVSAVEVTRKEDFVHYEGVLHDGWLGIIIIVDGKGK